MSFYGNLKSVGENLEIDFSHFITPDLFEKVISLLIESSLSQGLASYFLKSLKRSRSEVLTVSTNCATEALEVLD